MVYNTEKKDDMERTVGEFLKKAAPLCDSRDPAAAAARVMLEEQVTEIIVIREDRFLGILSVLDLLGMAYEETFDPGRDFLRRTLEDMVTREEQRALVREDSPLRAVHLMRETGLRTLPVLEGEKLLGIVRLEDLLSGAANDG